MAGTKGVSAVILYLSMILILAMPGALADQAYNCTPLPPGADPDQACNASSQMYTILRPSLNDTSQWIEMFQAAPRAYINPKLQSQLGSSGGAHITLLGHMNYTPSERDQGTCGNCWAWAGTSILEIALDTQLGIKDRLSMQYINSNYNGGKGSNWSCCGGWLEDLTRFYNASKILVPWSNSNAQWQDRFESCGTQTGVSAGSISVDPHYTLKSLQAVTIPTWEMEKEEAIANIKNVLGQGRGVWFGFFLPNQTAWTEFFNFWGYQPECVIWRPKECSAAYNFTNGGGHAVLCVGYNDQDPKNRYWIMLNSWGTTKSRPDGLFMVSMDMNYSCSYSGLGYAYYWMTLDADFEREAPPKAAGERNGEERSLAQIRDEAERKVEEAKEELDKVRADIDSKAGAYPQLSPGFETAISSSAIP